MRARVEKVDVLGWNKSLLNIWDVIHIIYTNNLRTRNFQFRIGKITQNNSTPTSAENLWVEKYYTVSLLMDQTLSQLQPDVNIWMD